MDKGGAYAVVVIPATLTRSLLLVAGVYTPGATPPAQAKVELQQNPRLGNLGVSLASGVNHPGGDPDLAAGGQADLRARVALGTR
jgi:hypothetical protein